MDEERNSNIPYRSSYIRQSLLGRKHYRTAKEILSLGPTIDNIYLYIRKQIGGYMDISIDR